MTASICVVLKGYPRLSETFIAQELLELERAGFSLNLVSLRHPTDRKTHPVHDDIGAPVMYLPEYVHHEPLRVFKGWLHSRRLPGYQGAFALFMKDLRRDFTRNRIRRFGQALVLARELPAETVHYYAHFIHTPASVANYARIMTGREWSCSAHAKDIWTSPDWELSAKLDSCAFVTTCTRSGAEHLKSLSRDPDRVHLVYHGIDLERFPAAPIQPPVRDGSKRDDPVQLTTVGRAVAKKGIDTLLEALARLPAGLHWRWVHIGGGELADILKAQADRLGISNRIIWMGSQPQTTVLERYRQTDIFVLPCRIAPNGDRDGLPNVLVEAASQRLACISTPISGVAELIVDGENGVLVPPDEPGALADAIFGLACDPERRGIFGERAAQKVVAGFDHRATVKRLVELFDACGVPRVGKAAQTAEKT